MKTSVSCSEWQGLDDEQQSIAWSRSVGGAGESEGSGRAGREKKRGKRGSETVESGKVRDLEI